MKRTVVVALGGNALLRGNQKGTVEEQLANTLDTMEHLVPLLKEGCNLVIGHGNGPQVGNILMQQAAGEETFSIPSMPLDVCVAESQGSIGYMIESALRQVMQKHGISREVLKEEVRTTGSGWRRVVPSPKPMEVLNASLVKKLAEDGVIVIAAGGGGIPVAYRADKTLEPIEAVIDKDSATSLLARTIGAEEFYILTDVPNVYINFRKPDEQKLENVTTAQLAEYTAKGMFGEGNMAPKIQAAVDFVTHGGKVSVITDAEALGSNGGTRISK